MKALVESMVRKSKIFVTMLVVAMMLLIGVTPALADPLPPDEGNLYIHKYIGGPTGGNANGTALDTSGWSSVVAVNGVVFKVYKVDTSKGIPGVGNGYTYQLNGNKLEVRDSTNALKGSYDVAFVDSVKTGETVNSTSIPGTAQALGLDQGLYLVIEDAAATNTAPNKITNAGTGETMYISKVVAPFLVAVPMTNPAGNDWLTDVHVYPKNEELSISKTVVTNPSVVVGDTVSYKIVASIPGDIETSKKFNIIDEMDEALDVVLKSVSAKTLTTDVGLVKGTDYTVTYDSATRVLTVAFVPVADPANPPVPPVGCAKLKGYASVEISFDATVNARILDKDGYSVRNDATVSFTNKDNVGFEAGTDEGGPVIHTAAIEIEKVKEDSITGLDGSAFKIADTKENAEAGKFMRIDPDTKIIYKPSDGQAWVDLGADPKVDNDYKIAPTTPSYKDKFEGLRDVVKVNDKNEGQTYWIVEVKAPTGYNLLSAPVEVKFSDNADDTTAPPSVPAVINHIKAVKVINSAGFTLPMTGGAGTIAFTVVGIMLLGLAAIVFISSRKREERDEII